MGKEIALLAAIISGTRPAITLANDYSSFDLRTSPGNDSGYEI